MIVKHVGAFFIEWEILFSIRVVPRKVSFRPLVYSPRTKAFFNELKILSNYIVKGKFKCGHVYAYAPLLLNLLLPSTWSNLFNSLNRRYYLNYIVKGKFKCGHVYAYAPLLLNLPLPSTWSNLFNSLNRRYYTITLLKANLNNVNKKIYIN